MTPAQIKKAEALLAKKQELLALKDRHEKERGKITAVTPEGFPILALSTDSGYSLVVGIDTLERWIKQAKKVQKMGLLG